MIRTKDSLYFFLANYKIVVREWVNGVEDFRSYMVHSNDSLEVHGSTLLTWHKSLKKLKQNCLIG